jgi:hypothetical protein
LYSNQAKFARRIPKILKQASKKSPVRNVVKIVCINSIAVPKIAGIDERII